MSNQEETLLLTLITKVDKLSDQMSDMKSSVSGTLEKHSAEIKQLQIEKKQIFTMINGDIKEKLEKLAGETQDNRHKLKNLDGVAAALAAELKKDMSELKQSYKETAEELTKNSLADAKRDAEEKGKLSQQNKSQNRMLAIVAVATVVLGAIQVIPMLFGSDSPVEIHAEERP